MEHNVIEVKDLVIKFSGDSGDGMQLTGTLFADASALFGNDISTFPDYPAEIRPPQGHVSGVSGFQVHIGNTIVNTPGDQADVLVAMNPAALFANAKNVKLNGSIILDADSFDESSLKKAGFQTDDPIAELKLADYHIVWAPITSLTKESLKESGMDQKSIVRCKNIFTLGMCYFMFNRPLHFTEEYLRRKFAKKPDLIEPNIKVLNDGYNYAHNTHTIANSYNVSPANLEKGLYRNINGNQATAWGLIAASEKSGLPLFVGSYPITPATAILEELALRKNLGVTSMQCEDEISGICTSIGAAYAGRLAVTTTSGPGLSLKSEALGLVCMTELPLVIVDVQRGGPSTGIPTKTEQTDLAQALYGRNGECPIMVIAAKTPSDCFRAAYMAAKFAVEHMMPVIFLSEGYLGNGSEPWRVPQMKDFPEIVPPIAKYEGESFKPFERDAKTFVRKWAIPGTPGLEHRVGGLEKTPEGAVSADPENHAYMVKQRAAKIDALVDYIPELEVLGENEGDLLLVGWGGTYGHIYAARERLTAAGKRVGFAHFEYINPLPKNTPEVFARYKKILVCELNNGQFADFLRAKYPQFSYLQLNKVQGQPFRVQEIEDVALRVLEEVK